MKENIKVPRHWPLCGEFTGTGEFPAQRASYAENVSIWWRHHVKNGVTQHNVGIPEFFQFYLLQSGSAALMIKLNTLIFGFWLFRMPLHGSDENYKKSGNILRVEMGNSTCLSDWTCLLGWPITLTPATFNHTVTNTCESDAFIYTLKPHCEISTK